MKKKYNCINGYIWMLDIICGWWKFLHYYVSDSTQIWKNVYHTMIKNMSYKSIIPYGVGTKCAKHETSNTMKNPRMEPLKYHTIGFTHNEI